LGRAFHFGQSAAIGPDGREQIALPLQFYAAQGVAAAFVVCSEDRAADQFPEETGRNLVVVGFVEFGNRWKVLRILRRQLELAPFAANRRALAPGFDAEGGIGALPKNRAEASHGQHGGSGGVGFDAGHFVADPYLKVSRHERGSVLAHFEFDILQNRLGAACGCDSGHSLERVQQLFAVASDFHLVKSFRPGTARR
jgi:hypothetical protein